MAIDTRIAKELEHKFVEFLETGTAPEGLFADDVFLDLTLPQWWLQTQGRDEIVRIRTDAHPDLGKVVFTRLDPTESGFVLEFHERWDSGGQSWYCRELMRADVADGRIAEAAIYCAGDWDQARQREHAASVTLLRP